MKVDFQMIELIKRNWPYFLAGGLVGAAYILLVNWVVNKFYKVVKSIQIEVKENGEK